MRTCVLLWDAMCRHLGSARPLGPSDKTAEGCWPNYIESKSIIILTFLYYKVDIIRKVARRPQQKSTPAEA
jgi:hypothetical protein